MPTAAAIAERIETAVSAASASAAAAAAAAAAVSPDDDDSASATASSAGEGIPDEDDDGGVSPSSSRGRGSRGDEHGVTNHHIDSADMAATAAAAAAAAPTVSDNRQNDSNNVINGLGDDGMIKSLKPAPMPAPLFLGAPAFGDGPLAYMRLVNALPLGSHAAWGAVGRIN